MDNGCTVPVTITCLTVELSGCGLQLLQQTSLQTSIKIALSSSLHIFEQFSLQGHLLVK